MRRVKPIAFKSNYAAYINLSCCKVVTIINFDFLKTKHPNYTLIRKLWMLSPTTPWPGQVPGFKERLRACLGHGSLPSYRFQYSCERYTIQIGEAWRWYIGPKKPCMISSKNTWCIILFDMKLSNVKSAP